MKREFFTVEDNFYFAGRQGTIVVGTLAPDSLHLIDGKVILVHSDGKEINTKVSGIEMTSPPNFEKVGVWFESLTKEDIPIGTKVLIDTSK